MANDFMKLCKLREAALDLRGKTGGWMGESEGRE
jgi:hypothetical protein